MAFTLQTSVGNLNLNDGVRYRVLDWDLGDTVVEESWIESYFADTPVLSNVAYRKTQVSIDLMVYGRTSVGGAVTWSNLAANLAAVAAEFSQNNNLIWAYDGINTKSVVTYKSALNPVDVSGENGLVITRDFVVPRWNIQVWRHPKTSGQTVALVI